MSDRTIITILIIFPLILALIAFGPPPHCATIYLTRDCWPVDADNYDQTGKYTMECDEYQETK